MIEVIVAIILTTVGILSVLSMEPMSWRTASKSDLLGKAAGILQQELSTQEMLIMNPNNTVSAGTTSATVYPKGEASTQAENISYTVSRTIADNGNGSWTVAATVSWPMSWPGSNSISESVVVTRQEGFRY
jgi:Tfp pilus assembly protein PilE